MPRPRDLKLERTWRQHFQRQRTSGLSIRDYCFEHELVESGFHAWRRIVAERDLEAGLGKPSMPAFVPITVVDAPTGGGDSPIDIRLANGRRVRVRSGCDRDLLATVLALLESRPC
jgi:hypothetical protein